MQGSVQVLISPTLYPQPPPSSLGPWPWHLDKAPPVLRGSLASPGKSKLRLRSGVLPRTICENLRTQNGLVHHPEMLSGGTTSTWYVKQSSLYGTWYCIGVSYTHLECHLLSPPTDQRPWVFVSFTHTTRGTPLNAKLQTLRSKTNTFAHCNSRECCQYPRTPAGSPGSSHSRSL